MPFEAALKARRYSPGGHVCNYLTVKTQSRATQTGIKRRYTNSGRPKWAHMHARTHTGTHFNMVISSAMAGSINNETQVNKKSKCIHQTAQLNCLAGAVMVEDGEMEMHEPHNIWQFRK